METDLSVVVPCFNESGSLPELRRCLAAAFAADGDTAVEFVLVDDGSADGSPALLQELAATADRVVPVVLSRRGGQTQALWRGLQAARGRWVGHQIVQVENLVMLLRAVIESRRRATVEGNATPEVLEAVVAVLRSEPARLIPRLKSNGGTELAPSFTQKIDGAAVIYCNT